MPKIKNPLTVIRKEGGGGAEVLDITRMSDIIQGTSDSTYIFTTAAVAVTETTTLLAFENGNGVSFVMASYNGETVALGTTVDVVNTASKKAPIGVGLFGDTVVVLMKHNSYGQVFVPMQIDGMTITLGTSLGTGVSSTASGKAEKINATEIVLTQESGQSNANNQYVAKYSVANGTLTLDASTTTSETYSLPSAGLTVLGSRYALVSSQHYGTETMRAYDLQNNLDVIATASRPILSSGGGIVPHSISLVAQTTKTAQEIYTKNLFIDGDYERGFGLTTWTLNGQTLTYSDTQISTEAEAPEKYTILTNIAQNKIRLFSNINGRACLSAVMGNVYLGVFPPTWLCIENDEIRFIYAPLAGARSTRRAQLPAIQLANNMGMISSKVSSGWDNYAGVFANGS